MNSNTTRQVDLGWARLALLSAAPYSVHEASKHAMWGLAFARQRGVHSVGDNNRRQDFDAWPGELAMTAPGVPIFSESSNGGEYLTLHLQQPACAFSTEMDDSTATSALRHVYPGNQKALRRGWQLRKLLLAHQPNLAQIEEQAALLIVHGQSQVQRQRIGNFAKPRSSRYEPDRQAHAKVLQQIHDALDKSLPLTELASTAGMEPLRFLRSFTHALGCTPHAYILEARLQKARTLLHTTNDSLAAIALDCGFAHQAHLGAALKQRLGNTPLAYRQGWAQAHG